MEFLEDMRKNLKPVDAYIMESGPFGSNTLLLIIEENRIGDVERFLERFEIDMDVAVITPEEFERFKDSIVRGGKRLW